MKLPTHLKPTIGSVPCLVRISNGTLALPWTGEKAFTLLMLDSRSHERRTSARISSNANKQPTLTSPPPISQARGHTRRIKQPPPLETVPRDSRSMSRQQSLSHVRSPPVARETRPTICDGPMALAPARSKYTWRKWHAARHITCRPTPSHSPSPPSHTSVLPTRSQPATQPTRTCPRRVPLVTSSAPHLPPDVSITPVHAASLHVRAACGTSLGPMIAARRPLGAARGLPAAQQPPQDATVCGM